MTPWLRAPAALSKDLGLIPSIHVVAHNRMELQFQGIQWSPRVLNQNGAQTHMQAKHSYT